MVGRAIVVIWRGGAVVLEGVDRRGELVFIGILQQPDDVFTQAFADSRHCVVLKLSVAVELVDSFLCSGRDVVYLHASQPFFTDTVAEHTPTGDER